MKIGAHVSTAGGISNAVGRGQEIGCEAIQIFGSSPQTWSFKPEPGEQVELFKQGLIDPGIGPVFLHAIMSNQAFADVPFLLEVPGFEGKGLDQQNIDLLKKIRQQVGVAP
ncbi:MAG: hypothetical protein O2913_01145 [Chloroflexi bacterium]|nr:hypothetical protein [Chloroflexota bacterium]